MKFDRDEKFSENFIESLNKISWLRVMALNAQIW